MDSHFLSGRFPLSFAGVFLSDDASTKLLVTSLFVVIGGIIAAAIWFSLRAARKRREALQQIATQMGCSYERNGADFRRQLGNNFHLFKLGSGRKLSNLLRGTCTLGEVVLFDYEYSEGSDENSSTYYQTVAAFSFTDAPLPTFHLGAGQWWHKLGKLLGYKTVAFDTHPQFSKRYALRGPDENAIRQFFRPAVLEYFQSLPEKPVWNLEASAPWLLVFVPHLRYKPEGLPAFRDTVVALVNDVMNAAETRRSAQAR